MIFGSALDGNPVSRLKRRVLRNCHEVEVGRPSVGRSDSLAARGAQGQPSSSRAAPPRRFGPFHGPAAAPLVRPSNAMSIQSFRVTQVGSDSTHFWEVVVSGLDLSTVVILLLLEQQTRTVSVICQEAKAAGTSAKMVRFYERIGLVPTLRAEGGDRTRAPGVGVRSRRNEDAGQPGHGLGSVLIVNEVTPMSRLIRAAVDLRAGRSLADPVGTLQEPHGAKVDLLLHQQAIDTTTPAGRAMCGMLGGGSPSSNDR